MAAARDALRTPLCDLFGIDVPIVQASLGAASSPQLTAAASNAGALGTLGVAILSRDETRRRIAEVRELTDRPFVLNTTFRPLREEVYAEMLAARPAVVSISLGISRRIVEQAHDAGVLFVIQVDSVEHAEEAAALGVDAVIAQGGEAGGLGGEVSTLVLVPQIVDRVAPVPVIAAGGIADGRGMAAALDARSTGRQRRYPIPRHRRVRDPARVQAHVARGDVGGRSEGPVRRRSDAGVR